MADSLNVLAPGGRGKRLQFGVCLALAGCLMSGCKSASPSQYVSPRVTGRVVNAKTHQPIEDVQVRRLSANKKPLTGYPPPGDEALEKLPVVVKTRSDGTFVLQSERSLALFRRITWYTVHLSFKHPGYQRFIATYTITDATNSPSGEPQVNAGDIPLVPLAP